MYFIGLTLSKTIFLGPHNTLTKTIFLVPLNTLLDLQTAVLLSQHFFCGSVTNFIKTTVRLLLGYFTVEELYPDLLLLGYSNSKVFTDLGKSENAVYSDI